MVQSNSYLRGQYLIALDTHKLNGSFLESFDKQSVWNGYTIFTGGSLPVTQVSSETVQVLLLGYVVHYEHHNLGNQELLSWVVSNALSAEDAIKLIQDCGGRYVALIRDKSVTVAVTDCCALRQIYWFNEGNILVMSSSAKLVLDALGQKPELEEKVSTLLNNDHFRTAESPWYGDKWYDKRIKKVLANHFLDMKSISVHRIKYQYTGPSNYKDILSYACIILKGLVKAIHSRYNIIQPLTAGYDSRLVLAASKSLSNKTRYYIIDDKYNLSKKPDVKISTALCKKLGLNFEVIMPVKLQQDFLVEYQKLCFFPRILPKTSHIQWHYYVHRDDNVINVTGNCGGAIKGIFRNKVRKGNEREGLTRIAGFNRFFESEVNMWYFDAVEFCRTNDIYISDLFYWEQRMSNWCATYLFEQDIAIEEFTPYNHKNLLLALLHVDMNKRKGPQCLLHKELINQLWPECLSLPFNPIAGLQLEVRLKRFVKQFF